MMISFNVFNVKVYIAITQVFAYELLRPQTLRGNEDISFLVHFINTITCISNSIISCY